MHIPFSHTLTPSEYYERKIRNAHKKAEYLPERMKLFIDSLKGLKNKD